ncbi:MAG: SRPBCC domain-containing protein [Caulobacteraceae bacterium]
MTPQSPKSMGVSGSNEAIHQEVVFKASAERIYHILTDTKTFDRVVAASGAMQNMALGNAPTQISMELGGSFSLFGGYISGRQLELTPGVRIVQAWRSAGWKPHIYSVAKFELAEHTGGVELTFDQTGFPNGEGASLANGWHEHYWAPISKILA